MFKFRLNPQKIAAIEDKVKKDVKEILASEAVLNEVGKMVVERLRFQARIEKPFNEQNMFPRLKLKTMDHRRYLEQYNSTHPTYETRRSNLTITGAFLDSLTYLVKGPGLLELFFKGNHPGYRGRKGKLKSAPVKNQDLFKWLKDKGFAAFDKTVAENKILKSRIKTIVLRFIRRGLKVRNSK